MIFPTDYYVLSNNRTIPIMTEFNCGTWCNNCSKTSSIKFNFSSILIIPTRIRTIIKIKVHTITSSTKIALCRIYFVSTIANNQILERNRIKFISIRIFRISQINIYNQNIIIIKICEIEINICIMCNKFLIWNITTVQTCT